MSYTDQMSIALGSSYIGKSLQARLRDSQTGLLVSGHESITTGFTELGDGHYLWNYSSFPDDTRVVVEILEQGQTEILVVSAPMDAWSAGAAIDGIAPVQLAEILLSYIAGTSTLVDHGNGTKTITYRKQGGQTDPQTHIAEQCNHFISTEHSGFT